MMRDIDQIIRNLLNFYNFNNKNIISVGAGGGQFIEYGRVAQKVYAIDNDLNALKQLEKTLKLQNITEKFELIHSDFKNVKLKGDVVLFEFCFHEMQEHISTINHALKMSKDIVITDHDINSEWAYYVEEEVKATQSWNAAETFPILKNEVIETKQYFEDYTQLYNKVHIQGETTINRIKKFKDQKKFSIPMKYRNAYICV